MCVLIAGMGGEDKALEYWAGGGLQGAQSRWELHLWSLVLHKDQLRTSPVPAKSALRRGWFGDFPAGPGILVVPGEVLQSEKLVLSTGV